MIRTINIRTFKTLESVTFDLGLVNVFIGANGSGKSNLLEAIGVLSAAADGQVNDQALLSRGVRPSLPALYKTAFPGRHRMPPHLFFGAIGDDAKYEVSLHNPLDDPSPAWKYKTELWESPGKKIVGRSPAQAEKTNSERGLAALKAVEVPSGPGIELLNALQGFVIYSPTTPVLRGVDPERQPRKPVGLSGGQLPQAVSELLRQRKKSGKNPELTKQICRDALALIDWATAFGSSDSKSMSLSPAAAAGGRVVHFRDQFMRSGRNLLSGYDASKGALFVLFLAVVAGHYDSPQICAIDNADVAGVTYASGSIIDSPRDDLPCETSCPPPSATTNQLRSVVLSWLGERNAPTPIVFCMPSKSIETWVLAAICPDNRMVKRANWECRDNPESQLGTLPRAQRFAKTPADYRARRFEITSNWASVASRLTEAARFQKEFEEAVKGR